MSLILSIIINTIAVLITSYLLSGIHIRSFWIAIIVAIVLGIVNAIIRPILFIITLPINILTLGLFSFIIMGLCVWLVSAIVPGFKVDGFWWAVAFAIILAIVNWLLNLITPGR